MIDINALFKVSYGLYIVCSGNSETGNGYVSNTVFQVSSSPALFATCCNKDNHTAGIIRESGLFSVSVLHTEADSSLIGTFGYKSGKETEKLSKKKLKYGESGVPIVLDDAIAFLECRVVNTLDVGTHLMFIGELLQAEVLDDAKDALTYHHYREVKKGLAPKNAPTYVDKSSTEAGSTTPIKDKPAGEERWECGACGYVYDEAKEGTGFKDLDDDWVCPVCGAEKEDFYKL